MTLAEFLLARIAEDEEVVRDEIEHDADHDLTRWGSSRVLAECDAKRRIVERWRELHPDVLRILALPYADDPDYDQEWRP